MKTNDIEKEEILLCVKNKEATEYYRYWEEKR